MEVTGSPQQYATYLSGDVSVKRSGSKQARPRDGVAIVRQGCLPECALDMLPG